MAETTLPRDPFSEALRAFEGNPGAARSESTVHLTDFLGRSTTWVITTFRADGQDTVLLLRVDANGSMREVLPPAVCAAISRQRTTATGVNRRRGARKAVATKLAEGQTIGNAAALSKARKARRRG